MTSVGWQWVVLAFLAAVGGVIGSFLNVVIYRLPAGRSIIWPGSHCPGCGHPIRWYDNLPVVSWFLLRGRCRDCRTKISWRYPAIEAATIGLFVLLGWWELMSGGQHLPVRPIQAGASVLWMPWTGRDLAALYAYHLMLCCTLLAAALIEHDHPRLSGGMWFRLYWPALVWGITAGFIWPVVHPVPAFGPGRESWQGRLLGLVDSLVGLAVGAAIGVGWGLIVGLIKHSSRNEFATLGFWMPVVAPAGLVGLYLGWQACLAVALVTGLLYILTDLWAWWVRPAPPPFPPIDRLSPIPFSAWLGLGSLLWILFWKHWLDWSQRLF